jgi:hypothetical protein
MAISPWKAGDAARLALPAFGAKRYLALAAWAACQRASSTGGTAIPGQKAGRADLGRMRRIEQRSEPARQDA